MASGQTTPKMYSEEDAGIARSSALLIPTGESIRSPYMKPRVYLCDLGMSRLGFGTASFHVSAGQPCGRASTRRSRSPRISACCPSCRRTPSSRRSSYSCCLKTFARQNDFSAHAKGVFHQSWASPPHCRKKDPLRAAGLAQMRSSNGGSWLTCKRIRLL